jgi:ribonuclease D
LELRFGTTLAIDTEAMGLNIRRDRLCMVQITDGCGDIHLVHFPEGKYDCPNLKAVLVDKKNLHIMHFARFDVAILQHYLEIDMQNIFCTKIASRLCRTYTEYHGLKDLCSDLLGVKISKQQQSSNWGKPDLTQEQIEYAAADVLYLHQLYDKLCLMLQVESRLKYAKACFEFIPTRAKLDCAGWLDQDIFAH